MGAAPKGRPEWPLSTSQTASIERKRILLIDRTLTSLRSEVPYLTLSMILRARATRQGVRDVEVEVDPVSFFVA